MADKKNKDKDIELLGGAQYVDPEQPVSPEAALRQEQAEHQHDVFVENIESHRCPYHGQDLKVQKEKRVVKVLDENQFETGKTKEITVKFAVCSCATPGVANPYRGTRVWEQT